MFDRIIAISKSPFLFAVVDDISVFPLSAGLDFIKRTFFSVDVETLSVTK